MSLRLAVKRSLDDAARDDSDIRDAAVIMEALQGLSVADLKRFLHPIRKSPYLELPPSNSHKGQRIDVSLLLEVLPEWLLEEMMGRSAERAGRPARLIEGPASIGNALHLLFNICQLSKKEVIELEDYVDASTDKLIDVDIAAIVLGFQNLLEYPPSSENAATIEALVDVLATGFEMIGFIADLELDHHSHQQPALTALSVHLHLTTFLSASVDILTYVTDEDELLPKENSSYHPVISRLSRSILDALERLCLVEELLTKLLSLPKAADCYLLDVSLSIFQDPCQDESVRDSALKLLLRLSEEDSFLSKIIMGDSLKKVKQLTLILENFITQSIDNGNYSLLVRLLAMQLLVAFTEIPQLTPSIGPGAVSVIVKYLAGDPEELRSSWPQSQIEYISLLRLVAALFSFHELGSESRRELMNKVIGPSKGKGALLKKAITSNAVYSPNLVENMVFLLSEVIGSIKWRKLVSLDEATEAIKFYEDLDDLVGSKRKNDQELSEKLKRLKGMTTGFRGQHWRAMWHVHDFRKPIALTTAPTRASAHTRRTSNPSVTASNSAPPNPNELEKRLLTVLGPQTALTTWVKHRDEAESDEPISVLDRSEDPSQAGGVKSRSEPTSAKEDKDDEEDEEEDDDKGDLMDVEHVKPRVKTEPKQLDAKIEPAPKGAEEDDEDLETAAAMLANTSAPTVWVKQQQPSESEEPISVMDDGADEGKGKAEEAAPVADPNAVSTAESALLDMARTVIGPNTVQTTVVFQEDNIDVLNDDDADDNAGSSDGDVESTAAPPVHVTSPKGNGAGGNIDVMASASDNDSEESSYEAESPSKRGSVDRSLSKKPTSPPRMGTKRKATDSLESTSPMKKQRTPDRDGAGVPEVVDGIFSNLTFRISKGVASADDLASLITRHGGMVLQYTTKHTTHYIATEEEYDEFGPQLQAALKRQLPIISSQFVYDSIEQGKKLEETAYAFTSTHRH